MEYGISESRPPIFIVGNSRSGTTMLMRMFNRHPEVQAINESHFFEKYWNPADGDKKLELEPAAALLQKLITRQRDGFFAKSNKNYYNECLHLVGSNDPAGLSKIDVFRLFMCHEKAKSKKSVICEKTPQHIFYISEILRLFPTARIINMVRDPRAVLASQKNKWRRRSLGSNFMPFREALRLRINYHPITMCQLWNASVSAIQSYNNHPQVRSVRYEDLLNAPQEVVREICRFTKLEFSTDMLNIEVASSSTKADRPSERGIHNRSVRDWEKHLTNNEIAIVQKWCRPLMAQWQYRAIDTNSSQYSYLLSLLSYPWKVGLALLINLSRLQNIGSAISRRLMAFKLQKA
mgnify:CR=1 FL=1